MKFKDQVSLENFFFVHKDVQADLPAQLLNTFSVKPGTPGSLQFCMELPKARTQIYGINSITYRSETTWNTIITQLPGIRFHKLSKHTCKKKITNHYLNMYHPA